MGWNGARGRATEWVALLERRVRPAQTQAGSYSAHGEVVVKNKDKSWKDWTTLKSLHKFDGALSESRPIRSLNLQNLHLASGLQLAHNGLHLPCIMPRAPKPSGKSRHDPLYVQLGEDEQHAKYGKLSHPSKRKKSNAREDEDDEGGEVCLVCDHQL